MQKIFFLLIISTALQAMDKKDRADPHIEIKVAHEQQTDTKACQEKQQLTAAIKPVKKSCLARLLCCCKRNKKILPQSNILPQQRVPALYTQLNRELNAVRLATEEQSTFTLPTHARNIDQFNWILKKYLNALLEDPKAARELQVTNDALAHLESDDFDLKAYKALVQQNGKVPLWHAQSPVRQALEQLGPQFIDDLRKLDEPVENSFNVNLAFMEEMRNRMALAAAGVPPDLAFRTNINFKGSR
jgi:hypothetical protein